MPNARLLFAAACVPFGLGLDSTTLSSVISEIEALIPTADTDRVDVLGAMLRLPFHDAFGHGTRPDGCLDPTEVDHNGLPSIVSLVEPVCAKYEAQMSRADCWAIVGNVAIEEASTRGRETSIPMHDTFKFGRVDCADESAVRDSHDDGESLLPMANPGGNPWDHIVEVFQTRAGFSTEEIVALMGAHSLGRPSSDADSNSGFSALPWIGNADQLTNTRYYGSIMGSPWVKNQANSEWLFTSREATEPSLLMLETDMALVIDTSSCTISTRGPSAGTSAFGGEEDDGTLRNGNNCAFNEEPKAFVEAFTGDITQFYTVFQRSMHKLTELGYCSFSLGATTWTSTLCEVTDTSSQKACDSVETAPTSARPAPTSPPAPTTLPPSAAAPTNAPVSWCEGVNCGNHGTCDEANEVCVCTDDYTGTRCETAPLDPCDDVDCNSGTCREGQCDCIDDYMGDNCETPPAPTCDDGIKNGDELGVDCGGSATNCPVCDSYSWTIGAWGSCSVSCGGGTQSRDVTCHDQNGVEQTEMAMCKDLHPADSTQTCNTAACATFTWFPGEWEDCSAECGEGSQFREVSCSSSLGGSVNVTKCDNTTKPEVEQACKTGECTSETMWVSGTWSTCDRECSGGSQVRPVMCLRVDSSTAVEASECDSESQPEASRTCNLDACDTYTWTPCAWDECSATCNGGSGMLGIRNREILCESSLGNSVDPSLCGTEPGLSSMIDGCNTQPCADFNWMADDGGLWSACVNGKQTRTFHCHAADGANTNSDDDCGHVSLPLAERACELYKCPLQDDSGEDGDPMGPAAAPIPHFMMSMLLMIIMMGMMM